MKRHPGGIRYRGAILGRVLLAFGRQMRGSKTNCQGRQERQGKRMEPPMNANERRWKRNELSYLRLSAFIGGSNFRHFLDALGVLGG
jgi:hypothetical protein